MTEEPLTALLLPLRKGWKPPPPGSLGALLGEVWAGQTYPNLQPHRGQEAQKSQSEQKSSGLGSNPPARLKIFPTAWAKFICQSPKEPVLASVWKCQPVWLEEREESFPLNSRKHMGGGWRPTPQPANSCSSGAKRGPEGSGIPTTSQGGGAEDRDGDSSNELGRKWVLKGGEQECPTGTLKLLPPATTMSS